MASPLKVIPIENFAFEILEDLPRLYALNPNGISIHLLHEEYGESPQRILRAITILEEKHHVTTYRAANNTHYILPANSIPPSQDPLSGLSELQRNAVKYLTVLCKEHNTNLVRTNYGQLARILNCSVGGIRTCIGRLSTLGYLAIESASQHGRQDGLVLRLLPPSDPNLPS